MKKRIGLSRIGRIILSKEEKRYVSSPNIIIPIKRSLINMVDFLEEFEKHPIFLISNEIFLKKSFLRAKFKENEFLYTHYGTIEKFHDILEENISIFLEDNIIALIPFNNPTTVMNKEFAKREVEHHIKSSQELLIKNPKLNFGITIKLFGYAELVNLYFPLIQNNPNVKILNFGDLFDNKRNFRKILQIIFETRKEVDQNLLYMVSGKILPNSYPMLIYLGFDLIDSSYMLYLSSANFYDTIEHLLPIYKVQYFPCSCCACKGKLKKLASDKFSKEKVEQLTLHNLITAKNQMHKIKQFIKTEDYRNFVEKSSMNDTNLMSILKLVDHQYFEDIRQETPIMQEVKPIVSIGPSSYFRPDFQEYREEIIKKFEPEPWTKLIILLPCSAKKPYSESKSHKKFLDVMHKFKEFPDFQEFIITSPLGIIPRQLENIYPVNSYDISVTGEWDSEEMLIAQEMLAKIIKMYDPKIPIICHLPKEAYHEIVNNVMSILPNKVYFSEVDNSVTSYNSLKSLENLLIKCKDIFNTSDPSKKSQYHKSWIRKFVKILDYQFGKGIGMALFSDEVKVYPNKDKMHINIRDVDSKKIIGVFVKKSGQLELTLYGSNRIKDLIKNTHFMVFDGEIISGNTLFKPGVINFSDDLKPNNFAFIWNQNKEEIIGIARMLVGSPYIKNSSTGRIAKIYEKKKK
ncbi:MAG: DUF5591 domain-containing protein [Promethearchaeota archaeon]